MKTGEISKKMRQWNLAFVLDLTVRCFCFVEHKKAERESPIEMRKVKEKDVRQKVVYRRNRMEEMKEAKEKMTNLEEQLTIQKTMMEEQQGKMVMLERLIERQCLVVKENDDKRSYEQLALAQSGM